MLGRSGNSIRNVIARRPSAVSSHCIHHAPRPATFSPALASTSVFARMTHSSSAAAAAASSSSPASAAKEQRRYQSAPAAAQQMASPEVNIASQFPAAFAGAESVASLAPVSQQNAEYPHHITLVKKVKKDGSPCRKCVEVLARIEREGYTHRIDRIVIADEANPMSEGMQMAQTFKVKTAPFFLVDSNVDKNTPTELFTVYFKLKREILAKDLSEEQQIKDIQESPQVQELVDFI